MFTPDVTCPYCQFPIEPDDPQSITCPGCNKVYHSDCWEDSGGCAIISCNITNKISNDLEKKAFNSSGAKSDADADSSTFNTNQLETTIHEEVVVEKKLHENLPQVNDDISKEREFDEEIEKEEIAKNSVINKGVEKPRKYGWYILAAAVFIITTFFVGAIKIESDSAAADNAESQALASEEINENGNAQDESISWNGGIYVGDIKNGKPHGRGEWIGLDGDVYEGEWSDGVKQGLGTHIWSDGRKYHGSWENDNRHGEGKWTHPNGGSYDGEWENDILHGYGTRVWPNGDKYVGEYKYNKRDGYGVFIYGNGDKYEGEWKDHLYHGQGIKTCTDGRVQEGDWVEGNLINQPTESSSGSEIVPLAYVNACEQKIYLHINGRFASVIHPNSEFRFFVYSGVNVFDIYDQNKNFVRRYNEYVAARNDNLMDVYQFTECYLLPN